MPKPKRLSGSDVVRILELFDFEVKSQRGSHIKLARTHEGEHQILLVPNHDELKTGAVVGIFRQACRYISEHELRGHFYTN